MTVGSVQVVEGKATELNFTLAEDPPRSPPSAAAVPPTPPGSSSAPAPQPVQPQDFRHHHYNDMELFLRRYSTDYPAITRLYSIGTSVQKRSLFVMEISDKPGVHEEGTAPSAC